MKREPILLLTLILGAYIIGPKTVPVQAVSWGPAVGLPGADQYNNYFPRMLQASNGSIWLVWEKVTSGGYGEIYLMVNNGFGWSGQIALLNSNGAFDDVAPALTQLANGTIILAWSRGVTGTGACFPRTYDIYTMSFNNQWSQPQLVVNGTGVGDSLTPVITTLQDGRMMMAYSVCNSTNGRGDIYYKVWNQTWGPSKLLVGSTTNEEKLPSIKQTADGHVWVVYTANTASGNMNQLWDTIWNGTTWTSPAMFTNPTADDDWPTIAQDRNNTLWVFWARNLSNGTLNGQPSFQYDLFYKNSTNNGQTWSPEQTIVPSLSSDEKQPSVIQTTTSKRLWLAYSSDQNLGNPFKTYNLYLVQSDIVKIHSLAVTSIGMPPPYPYRRVGDVVNVSVTVANYGDYAESPKVNCYTNGTYAAWKSVTINPGQVGTVTVPWNTTNNQPGLYLIGAIATPVTSEYLIGNNSMNLSTSFPLSFRGDVTRHGMVNIVDLAVVGAHFGAVAGSPNYYPDADLTHSGSINISDLAITGSDFGKILPIHRLAMLTMTTPKTLPRIGEKVTVTANVTDTGVYAEIAPINLYVNSALTSSATVNIQPGQTLTVTFSWIATTAGKFQASVRAGTVANEFLNSNILNSTLTITFRGDVNRDGRVDISDLGIVAAHFGSSLGTTNYYAPADLNNDGFIDISDLAICGADFGKTL